MCKGKAINLRTILRIVQPYSFISLYSTVLWSTEHYRLECRLCRTAPHLRIGRKCHRQSPGSRPLYHPPPVERLDVNRFWHFLSTEKYCWRFLAAGKQENTYSKVEGDCLHLRVLAEPWLLVVTGRHRPEEVPIVDRHLDGAGSSGLQEDFGTHWGALTIDIMPSKEKDKEKYSTDTVLFRHWISRPMRIVGPIQGEYCYVRL